MPRGNQHHSSVYSYYSDEQKAAYNECSIFAEKIDKIETRNKIIAIITLVISVPIILILGIMFGLQKIESWIFFLVGGIILATFLVVLFFVIKGQIDKVGMKKAIKRICKEQGISYTIY